MKYSWHNSKREEMNTVVDISQCTNQRNDEKGVTHQKLDTTGGRVLISCKNHIKWDNTIINAR